MAQGGSNTQDDCAQYAGFSLRKGTVTQWYGHPPPPLPPRKSGFVPLKRKGKGRGKRQGTFLLSNTPFVVGGFLVWDGPLIAGSWFALGCKVEQVCSARAHLQWPAAPSTPGHFTQVMILLMRQAGRAISLLVLLAPGFLGTWPDAQQGTSSVKRPRELRHLQPASCQSRKLRAASSSHYISSQPVCWFRIEAKCKLRAHLLSPFSGGSPGIFSSTSTVRETHFGSSSSTIAQLY